MRRDGVVRALSIGMAAMAVASCSSEREIRFRVVKMPAFEGAIVPAEYMGPPSESAKWLGIPVEGYWTPSPEDVTKAEARVRSAMLAARTSLQAVTGPEPQYTPPSEYTIGEIRKIVENYDGYHLQYLGIVVSGKKRILCNFFPRSEGDRWLLEWWVVEDGGFWYWTIQYDIEGDRCLGFESNGYA